MSACLQDDVLCGWVIVAALLSIASIPTAGEGLIERLYSPEGHVQLMLVIPHYLCEVVHISVIVLLCQIVLLAIFVATAEQEDLRESATKSLSTLSSQLGGLLAKQLGRSSKCRSVSQTGIWENLQVPAM